MSWRSLILACALAMGTASAQSNLPLAQDELLLSARVWEARDRGDLARLALEKLVAARPDSPAALVELGELHLRMADIPSAQRVLAQLETRFAGSREAKTLATEVRFATRDRLALASVQRLIQVDRGADARNELTKLFPEGAPDGALGIEYFRLLASTPGGWEQAHAGLRTLVERHPGDPRYEFALARHLLGRDATAVEGVRRLTGLGEREDVRAREIDDPLARALKELGFRRAPLDALRAYARRHPEDADVRRIAAQRAQLEAEQQALLREIGVGVNADPQRRRALALQDALLAMRAGETPANAIELLRALRDASRVERFDEPTQVALLWSRRSLASGRTDGVRADLEQDVAIAFARRDYERVIGLLPALEQRASAEVALEALTTASRLQSESSWLFETRVRWLIDHARLDDALALLDSRPLDARWTAQTRDELRANALDRRAQAAVAAGDEERARVDLERAVAAAPAYAWTRFRLAGLHATAGDRERARALMHEGAQLAPRNPEMRYAQALLLSSIDDAAGALAALDHVPMAERTDAMHELARRLQVERARTDARRLFAAGDAATARRTLRDVQPLASENVDVSRQLADAWMDIEEHAAALAIYEPFAIQQRADKDVQLTWARLLNRANDPRLAAVLAQLQGNATLNAEERARIVALEQDAHLRTIRSLQRNGDISAAIEQTDALLARTPNDRSMRIVRAELDLASGRAQAARDRYAALVAEEPNDFATRLDYARALTDAGDIALAQVQVQSVAEQAATNDVELRLSLARRQLDLGDSAGARATLAAVLAADPTRNDALLLAGRAELAQRDFVRAREFFTQASRSSDLGVGSEARLAREAIETRLLSWTEGAIEFRHKPGDSGISQFDSWSVPTLWRYALDFERRLTVRADAITIDAGDLRDDFDTAALLGTIQAAGSNAARRFNNDQESGVSFGVRYDTDTFSADIGTTPLGFLLTNIVGGFEWAPEWGELDLAFGMERRAVTSSVLSYAGMRDPISGREWGGVVDTSAYAEAGWYREFHSVSGALKYSQLSGKHVDDNTFAGARIAADWKFWSRPQVRAFVGATLNLWSYEHNRQNYTFGHGGYYSPESYVSFAIPIEVQGTWRDVSYRVRVSAAYSDSTIERAAFYPSDTALQASALNAPLPSGFDAPFHTSGGGTGTSLSGYAAVEKQLTSAFVVGAKLDIDRADYYEPTVFMLYVRHVFGSAATPVEIPPRPVRLYNE